MGGRYSGWQNLWDILCWQLSTELFGEDRQRVAALRTRLAAAVEALPADTPLIPRPGAPWRPRSGWWVRRRHICGASPNCPAWALDPPLQC